MRRGSYRKGLGVLLGLVSGCYNPGGDEGGSEETGGTVTHDTEPQGPTTTVSASTTGQSSATAHDDGIAGGESGAETSDGEDESGVGPNVGVCGDGVRTVGEACDDGNTIDGDGCSSDCLSVGVPVGSDTDEEPLPELPPVIRCGDGVVEGTEACDDGNLYPGDGCTLACSIEDGFYCDVGPEGGSVCRPTVCGDGVVQGLESCDDGNAVPLDGCDARCHREPICQENGPCDSVCGDGMRVGDEECDDGNTRDGDGCSQDCAFEMGFTCSTFYGSCEQGGGSCVQRFPIIYRDFSESHPDFELDASSPCVDDSEPGEPTRNMVSPTLGVQGRLRWADANCSTEASFEQWFQDVPDVNVRHDQELVLFEDGRGGFTNRFDDLGAVWLGSGGEEHDGNPLFFPLDGLGPGPDYPARIAATYGHTDTPWEADLLGREVLHNFYFTSEVRTWFVYDSYRMTEVSLSTDGDAWLFINGNLALDLGGVHGPVEEHVQLDATTASGLGLIHGNLYQVSLFHAQRQQPASSLTLRIQGFDAPRSSCVAFCGDGVISAGESCDDGINDGGYAECGPQCTFDDYCGDGVLNGEYEECDDGNNEPNDGCYGCRLMP